MKEDETLKDMDALPLKFLFCFISYFYLFPHLQLFSYMLHAIWRIIHDKQQKTETDL